MWDVKNFSEFYGAKLITDSEQEKFYQHHESSYIYNV